MISWRTSGRRSRTSTASSRRACCRGLRRAAPTTTTPASALLSSPSRCGAVPLYLTLVAMDKPHYPPQTSIQRLGWKGLL